MSRITLAKLSLFSVLLFAVMFFFLGCGGGGSNNSVSNNPPVSPGTPPPGGSGTSGGTGTSTGSGTSGGTSTTGSSTGSSTTGGGSSTGSGDTTTGGGSGSSGGSGTGSGVAQVLEEEPVAQAACKQGFVYVANHGSGTITTFKMNGDGSLVPAGSTPATGVHWLASIGNKYVVATEEMGDPSPGQLQAFKVDSGTGALTAFSVAPLPRSANAITTDESASLIYAGTNDAIYGYTLTDSGFSPLPGSPYFANTPGQDPRLDKWVEALLITPFSPNLFAGYLGYRGSGFFAVIQRDQNGALTQRKICCETIQSVAAFAGGKFAYITGGNVFGTQIDSSGQPTIMQGVNVEPADRLANDPAGTFLFGTFNNANVDGFVQVYSIDSSSGMPTKVPGSPFSTQGKGAATVRVESQGNFVLIPNGSNFQTNTPSNNIAVFSLNSSTGALTPVPGSPFESGGSLPMDVVVVH